MAKNNKINKNNIVIKSVYKKDKKNIKDILICSYIFFVKKEVNKCLEI